MGFLGTINQWICTLMDVFALQSIVANLQTHTFLGA